MPLWRANKIKQKIVPILISILLVFPLACFAETIILKSGKKVKGKILERTDQQIKIDFYGVPLTYDLKDIERIEGQVAEEAKADNVQEKAVTEDVNARAAKTTQKDEIEQKFKDICIAIANESAQTISPAGEEHKEVSDKEIDETFARQRKLFKGWQEELRSLIKTNPKSVWADDAQYIVSALSMEDPKQEASELEYLIENYPDARIEYWTSNTLPAIIPKPPPIAVVAKWTLINDYKQLGEEEKAGELYKRSITEYPEYVRLFKQAYMPEEVSQEMTERMRKDYNEGVQEQKESVEAKN